MIRRCVKADFEDMYLVINEAAKRYAGVIPEDRYHSPYMGEEELASEIGSGVVFYGFFDPALKAVMGLQDVLDVTLIRHAYVLPEFQGAGLGTLLLRHLLSKTDRPVLVGTWADARWAISFYEKNGFVMEAGPCSQALLQKYWDIPERQAETSIVLSIGFESRPL